MKKYSPLRKSTTSTVGEAINDLLKSYRLNDKFDEKKLIHSWSSLMGKTIANRTGKIYIKNKILCVEINSGPLKNELNMSKSKVKSIIAKEFGDSVIQEIVFF